MAFRDRQSKRAFTLLELLVVITLIALLAVPVSVRVFENLHKMSLSGVISELNELASTASTMAVQLNVPVSIVIDREAGEVALGYPGMESAMPKITGITRQIARRLVLADAGLNIVNFRINGQEVSGRGHIIFLPDGSGDYAMLELKNAGSTASFLCRPAVAGTTMPGTTVSGLVINLDGTQQSADDIFR